MITDNNVQFCIGLSLNREEKENKLFIKEIDSLLVAKRCLSLYLNNHKVWQYTAMALGRGRVASPMHGHLYPVAYLEFGSGGASSLSHLF